MYKMAIFIADIFGLQMHF